MQTRRCCIICTKKVTRRRGFFYKIATLKIKSGTVAMFKKQKQVEDYRLQHLGQSVIIDERDGAISSVVRIVFGVCLALFSVVILLLPVFGAGCPDFSKYTIGSWLLLVLLFC